MTRDLNNLNLLAKLMVLQRHILRSLNVTVIAEAILMRTSDEQMPSLHRVAVHAGICYDAVCAVNHELTLFCADFKSICHCSANESSGEVLKFIIAADYKIDIVGKS